MSLFLRKHSSSCKVNIIADLMRDILVYRVHAVTLSGVHGMMHMVPASLDHYAGD